MLPLSLFLPFLLSFFLFGIFLSFWVQNGCFVELVHSLIRFDYCAHVLSSSFFYFFFFLLVVGFFWMGDGRDLMLMNEGLSEPFADVDPPVSFEALHFKEFDVKDLFFIHGLLHRNAQDIIFRVQEYSLDENSVLNQLHDSSDLSGTLRSPVPEESPDLLNRTTDYRGRLSSPSVLYSSDVASKLRPISGVFDQPFLSSDAEFVKLIGELGPPPPTGKRALSIRLTKNRRGENPDHRTSSSESGQLEEASQSDAELLRTQELIDIGLKNLLIKSTRFDTSALEQSGFFYRHDNDTAGDPVFYVILHR